MPKTSNTLRVGFILCFVLFRLVFQSSAAFSPSSAFNRSTSLLASNIAEPFYFSAVAQSARALIKFVASLGGCFHMMQPHRAWSSSATSHHAPVTPMSTHQQPIRTSREIAALAANENPQWTNVFTVFLVGAVLLAR